MTNKKFLVADDHSAIRKGVKYILSAEYKNVEFGFATNTVETIELLSIRDWDALILDIDLPGRNGFEVLQHIKDQRLKVPILVFSFHREEQIAVRALRSGAHGYLSKDAADNELIVAIRDILSGKKYVTQAVSEHLISSLDQNCVNNPHELLSNREYEVLILIASGMTLTQIADELSLSPPTISTYRARILDKMQMKSNAELMNYAMKKKLVN